MRCMSCKADEMTESKTAFFATMENSHVIIENVPCLKCSQCGDVFYRASVMEKIDKILEMVKKMASKICVMDYQKAA